MKEDNHTQNEDQYPVHYAGVSCEMKQIMEIAETNNLKVIEDATQFVNAKSNCTLPPP